MQVFSGTVNTTGLKFLQINYEGFDCDASRRWYARLSRSGPGFDPRSGQVSWVWFFWFFNHL